MLKEGNSDRHEAPPEKENCIVGFNTQPQLVLRRKLADARLLQRRKIALLAATPHCCWRFVSINMAGATTPHHTTPEFGSAAALICLLEIRGEQFPRKEEIQAGIWGELLSVSDRSRDLLR